MLKIVVASYTDTVTTIAFEPQASKLEVIANLGAGYRASWITPHPLDRTLAFVCLENSDGQLVAIRFDDSEEAGGKILGKIESGGSDPCHMAITKYQEIITANVSLKVWL